MTRAKDISKIVTDADLSGTLDVAGAFTSQGIDDNADATAITIDSSERVGIGTSSPSSYSSTTLEVKGSSTTSAIKMTNSTTGGGDAVGFDFEMNSNDMNFVNRTSSGVQKFWTNSTERMRITSAGNVLVGTTDAQIYDHTSGEGIVFRNGEAIDVARSGDSQITLNRMSNEGANISLHQSGTLRATIGTRGSGGFYIGTGGDNEKMRITSAGNVGIGTSSPSALLQVEGSDGVAGGAIMYTATGVASGYMSADAAGLCLATDTAGITFRTGITGADPTDTGTERMRINSSGTLLWASSADLSSSVAGISFTNSTHPAINISGGSDTAFRHRMTFINGNGTVGIISTSGSATTYSTSSDHRLKENVTADWDATTRLKQLNPVRFNFIADADTTVDGFLAHEVQSVVPEAITGTHNEVDTDGNPVYQGIDQSKLVPLLVKTIQELEARIVALETA